MADPSPVEFLGDPLSDIARKERRNLLIASTLGVLVAWAGLVPNNISAFGIELSAPAQDAFVRLVALSVLYFTSAFILYGVSDFLIWRTRYQDYLERLESRMQNWSQEDQHKYDELQRNVPDIGWVYKMSRPSAVARILFEYVVPILYGVLVIVGLLHRF